MAVSIIAFIVLNPSGVAVTALRGQGCYNAPPLSAFFAARALIQINVNRGILPHGRGVPETITPFAAFAQALLPAEMTDLARAPFAALAKTLRMDKDRAFENFSGKDQLVFLASGATKLVAQASAGREQVIAFHFAGDLVLLPARGLHTHGLHTLECSELVTFPYGDFLACAAQHNDLLATMLDRANVSLRRCRDKVIALGRKNAAERMASFLLDMASRIGTTEGAKQSLALPMSRKDIADSMGLTIETVSRQLTALKEEGLIETTGRSGILLNAIPRLEARAGYVQRVN